MGLDSKFPFSSFCKYREVSVSASRCRHQMHKERLCILQIFLHPFYARKSRYLPLILWVSRSDFSRFGFKLIKTKRNFSSASSNLLASVFQRVISDLRWVISLSYRSDIWSGSAIWEPSRPLLISKIYFRDMINLQRIQRLLLRDSHGDARSERKNSDSERNPLHLQRNAKP